MPRSRPRSYEDIPERERTYLNYGGILRRAVQLPKRPFSGDMAGFRLIDTDPEPDAPYPHDDFPALLSFSAKTVTYRTAWVPLGYLADFGFNFGFVAVRGISDLRSDAVVSLDWRRKPFDGWEIATANYPIRRGRRVKKYDRFLAIDPASRLIRVVWQTIPICQVFAIGFDLGVLVARGESA